MDSFYVDRVLPSGKRIPVLPGGKRFFGNVTLTYLRKRAKRRNQKIVWGVATDKRARMKASMLWALHNTADIHYQQGRPMPLARWKAHALPLSTDCSGSTTCVFYQAGLPDPNGAGYNGSGFTGTLRANMKQVSGVALLKVGDCIVYGPGSGSHVVMVFEPGPDPLCFSHGQENDPALYRHSVENAAHGGYFTSHDAGA